MHAEIQEKLEDKRLAATLGISLEDLNQLQWDIGTDESDDGLIYGYIIEFQRDSPKEILERIERLEDGYKVYLWPSELDGREDAEELAWEIASTDQLKIFHSHIISINVLLEKEFDQQTMFNLLVMLHIHIVAAVESFLSSTFIHKVTNSEELIRKLIETDPKLGDRKLTLSEIFKKHDKLKTTVASYLKSLVFHEMNKVKPMYNNVLGFNFGDVSWLSNAVILRHDCAHRAGYNKDGEKITITVESIKELVRKCTELCESIDSHILLSQY